MIYLHVIAVPDGEDRVVRRTIRQCRMALDNPDISPGDLLRAMRDLRDEDVPIYIGAHSDEGVIEEVTRELKEAGCTVSAGEEGPEAPEPSLDPVEDLQEAQSAPQPSLAAAQAAAICIAQSGGNVTRAYLSCQQLARATGDPDFEGAMRFLLLTFQLEA